MYGFPEVGTSISASAIMEINKLGVVIFEHARQKIPSLNLLISIIASSTKMQILIVEGVINRTP